MTSFCSRSKLKVAVPETTSYSIANELNCSPLVAALLDMQGRFSLHDIDKARAWLRPSLDFLTSSCFLGEAAKVVADKWRSLSSLGNVVVYGDYDVDGVSSTTLAMELCQRQATGVRYYIPHRHFEGYGLHQDVVQQLLGAGCDTLVIVDCGTKDKDILQAARKEGMNVFVFDHHLPDRDEIPDSFVVNPQIDGDNEARRLCATAVLWMWAYQFEIMPRRWLLDRLDLVALATVADCMPLEILNRALVKEGIQKIRFSSRIGLEQLIRKLGLSQRFINEEHLAMKVIPCLNAAGRLSYADLAVKVLIGEDNIDSRVEELISINRKRQNLSTRITKEAAKVVDEDSKHVLFEESWPVGVLSGVASRLCSEKNAPVVLAAPVRDWIRGTLRMPDGGNAVHVLDCLAGQLEAWGGHKQAAGFSVTKDNWEKLKVDLEQILSSVKYEEPEISALALHPSRITFEDWNAALPLGPFGMGNPCPLLFCERQGDEQVIPLGKTGIHAKIQCGSESLVAFNSVEMLQSIPSSKIEGWVYHPSINYWRGQAHLQFMLDYIVVDS
ncbi:MAG: DHH family phosphoesterase [Aminobacterium sp.]